MNFIEYSGYYGFYQNIGNIEKTPVPQCRRWKKFDGYYVYENPFNWSLIEIKIFF